MTGYIMPLNTIGVEVIKYTDTNFVTVTVIGLGLGRGLFAIKINKKVIIAIVYLLKSVCIGVVMSLIGSGLVC